MQRKLKVYIFSENEEKVNTLLRPYCFIFGGKKIKFSRSFGEAEYSGDSIDVYVRYKRSNMNIRGIKCDLLFVDRDYKEELENVKEFYDIFCCMLTSQVFPVPVQYF